MSQVTTPEKFFNMHPSDGYRRFVVAVDRKPLKKALDAFAANGVILPAVCEEQMVASVTATANAEQAKRLREDKQSDGVRERAATKVERLVSNEIADLKGGDVDDWATEGGFTLFQQDLLADFVSSGRPASHGELLVIHPADGQRYLKAGSFHATLFVERVDEITRLVQALCPKSMKLTMNQDQYKAVTAGVDAKALFAAVGASAIEARFEATASKGRAAVFEENFDRQPHAPSIPDDLHLISQSPEFKSLTDGRLKAYARDASHTLTFTESFGVDAKLSAKADRLGLGVDSGARAGFEHSFEQEIQLTVEWWPMPDALETLSRS